MYGLRLQSMTRGASKHPSPIRPREDGATIDMSPSPDRHEWAGCEKCGAMWDYPVDRSTVCWDLFVEGIA